VSSSQTQLFAVLQVCCSSIGHEAALTVLAQLASTSKLLKGGVSKLDDPLTIVLCSMRMQHSAWLLKLCMMNAVVALQSTPLHCKLLVRSITTPG
jgi:hypothetical protein